MTVDIIKTISIIVPVYNAEKYISRTIESVISQTFRNWELILVNDGSSDRSGEIVEEYGLLDKRIKIFHQDNKGASSARNLAIDNAVGQFFFFLDSDDYLPPDSLMNLILQQNLNDSDIVIGNFQYEINGNRYNYSHPKYQSITQFINDFLASSWVIIWGHLIRASIFKNIRFPNGIVYSEDFYTMMQVLIASDRISNCNNVVYYYNRDNESSVTNQDTILKIINERDVYLNCLSLLKDLDLLSLYERPLGWRLLKVEQALLHNDKYFNEFKQNYPEKKKYIFSCPFISKKMKLLMWLLCKKIDILAIVMIYIRKLINP